MSYMWDNLGIGIKPVSIAHIYEDSANVDATAGFTIEQDGAGDAIAQFLLTGGQRWVVGIDNSDGDKFKIASSENLNSDARLVVDPTTGNVGIGLAPMANMVGLSIEAGCITIKERATPIADTNYGKIYTKTDNKLYFQDGAGTEHEMAYV